MGEGERGFSKSLAPDKLTSLQWKTTHLQIFGQHKLFLMGKGGRHKVGWVENGGGFGKSWGRGSGDNQNT